MLPLAGEGYKGCRQSSCSGSYQGPLGCIEIRKTLVALVDYQNNTGDLQPVAALKPPYQVRHVKRIFLKGTFLSRLRNSGCVLDGSHQLLLELRLLHHIDNMAEVPAAEVALELQRIEQHRIMKTTMQKLGTTRIPTLF
ncbi:hypothetical protein HPP92_023683 [Vanilla planifolia]|uniref:Uncharacterized protein n=1 Tax=Vanilla planifolia TaxID=51239 RepID=A0A835PQS4_VANPL|nr:hypothetical protein HPP92_023683 [Vanilla planifolia]